MAPRLAAPLRHCFGASAGRPSVWGAPHSALQAGELKEVKKKQVNIANKNVGVGSGICQKLVKNISTVIRMHF
jgi:hypothetical protein